MNKQLKRWGRIAVLAAGVLAGSWAHGADGAGSSGGGHGLSEAGMLKLRELVEGVTCDWVDGPTFFKTYLSPDAEVDAQAVLLDQPLGFFFYFIIGDLDLLNAFYAETLNLNVCLSKRPLRDLPEEVREAVSSYQTLDIDSKAQAPTQIAIRLGNEVYIDRAAYEKLDPVNREYLRLHEIVHAFIPMGTPGRMTKLRDFIAGVREIDLTFDHRPSGHVLVELGEAFDAKVLKARQKYLALKSNNSVDTGLGPKKTAEQALVERYTLSGDVRSLKFILQRYGLSPNQKGSTGTSLFHELIAQLRECHTGDARPMCVHSDKLVSLYLSLGADPDMPFTTGEWDPMPVWRYLLRSAHGGQRNPRLVWAEQIYRAKIDRAGGLTADLEAELRKELFALARVNHLPLSAGVAIRLGADPNAVNEEGKNALLVAVEKKGHGDSLFSSYPATWLVGVLLVHGAEDDVKNADGKSALEVMKDFKGPLRALPGRKEQYELGVKALEAGSRGIEALRPEFEKAGMPLPTK